MIVCILVPRFSLLAVTRGSRELLMRPVALAPESGAGQSIGEVSGAAEGHGIRAGMRLSEALARCPGLTLLAPDPEGAESAWEETIRRLEGIGAAVESERPGEAFFGADGLSGLWGRPERVAARARRAIDVPARIGGGPTRFCAYAAAATRARPRGGAAIVPAGAARTFLSGLPVSLLRGRIESDPAAPGTIPAASSASRPGAAGSAQATGFVDLLWRLGVRTLGELAALPRDDVADRFGRAGLRALALAGGEDEPLRTRRPRERIAAGLDLPDAISGPQLERALEMLIDRLLADPARRGRSLRRLRLSARLAGGGGWRTEVALRRASSSVERLRLALAPKLGELPSPALALELRALATGPPAHDQGTLTRSSSERRRERLGEAIRQVRAAAGKDAVLRVLEIDLDSRVPERRVGLAPFPEPAAPGRGSE